MTDRCWRVDVQISTVVRRTITLPIVAASRETAEALARAEARQIDPVDLPAGCNAINWRIDNAVAVEVQP
jgi:hypothetical protein